MLNKVKSRFSSGKTIKLLLIFCFVISLFSFIFIPKEKFNSVNNLLITGYTTLDANNIKSYVWTTGVFDQNAVIQNYAGFEWVRGSGKTAIFTTGITIGGYVGNQLRLACASYR